MPVPESPLGHYRIRVDWLPPGAHPDWEYVPTVETNWLTLNQAAWLTAKKVEAITVDPRKQLEDLRTMTEHELAPIAQAIVALWLACDIEGPVTPVAGHRLTPREGI